MKRFPLFPHDRSIASRGALKPLLLFVILLLAAAGAESADVPGTTHAVPSPAPPPPLSAYHGDWRRIADPDADSRRMVSIDFAISDLSWLVRQMAAGVLKKTTQPPEMMKFNWDGAQLHQRTLGDAGDFDRPVKIGGEPEVLIDQRGEDFSSHWTWTDSGLQVNWIQEKAYGSNLYRVDEQDQTLVVEHRIHVTAISSIGPIVYESRFDRADPPAVSMGKSSAAPTAQIR